MKVSYINKYWFLKCILHHHRSENFSCGCNSPCVIYSCNSGVLNTEASFVFSFCPYKLISMLRFIALRCVKYLRTWRIYNAYKSYRDQRRAVDFLLYVKNNKSCQIGYKIVFPISRFTFIVTYIHSIELCIY